MSEASGGSAEIQWGGGDDFIGEKAGNEHPTSTLRFPIVFFPDRIYLLGS